MIKRSLGTVTAVLAVTLAGATACDRSTVEPPGHEELHQVVIVDRTVTPRQDIATWTNGVGWDTDVLMTLSHAAEVDRTRTSLGARMYTQGGEEIALGDEYTVQYGVASDPNDVINMDPALDLFHGDHVHIYGHDDGRTGTAQLVFALWHGGHDDGETDPINFTITD